MHVPKPCASNQKSCRQLSFPVRSFFQRWPKKKWQGSSSALTVACAREVLHNTSLALNIITEHCPELTKKQLHTMNGFESCPLFLFSSLLLSSLLFSSRLSGAVVLCCVVVCVVVCRCVSSSLSSVCCVLCCVVLGEEGGSEGRGREGEGYVGLLVLLGPFGPISKVSFGFLF